MNRWTFEPLLFVLPWIVAGTLALSFLLVGSGAGLDAALAVIVAVSLWAFAGVAWIWMRRGTLARTGRQSP